MFEPLQDAASIEAVNRFFNDLIAVADFEEQLPLLRAQVEVFRVEALTRSGMRSTQHQLRGFLWGLMVAGALTPEQAHDFSQRMDVGRRSRWS